ncbi:unnamed protein product, partial [Iphiclides podalirius]
MWPVISYHRPNYGRETTCPLSSVHRPPHILPCVLRAGPPPPRDWSAAVVRAQRPSSMPARDGEIPQKPVVAMCGRGQCRRDHAATLSQLTHRRAPTIHASDQSGRVTTFACD